MKNILPILFLCLPFISFSQIEANLLGTWSNDDLTPTSWLDSRYNDIWGDTINGLEIAIIGSTAGVHFIDVTDPTTPTELAFVAGKADGDQLVHRDYHSYNGYLYTVADEGPSSLQVIDMHALPDSVEVVYDSNELLVQAHNIFIDESRAMLYACNGNGFELKLISLADPANPVEVSSFTGVELPASQIHDMYARNDTVYLNGAFQGLFVMDFSEPTAPVLLGTMTDYPQSGYNHSGWLSDDGDYYYLCDETHARDVKTVSVADLTDISVTALFNAESTENQIAHNAIVTGDYLYVSYYYDGLQVFDVADPENPIRIAYYDTFDGVSDGGYQGAWGIYPYLPSGNVLVSDMNNGLFVIENIENLVDISLNSSIQEAATCINNELVFEITLGNDFSSDGVDLSTAGLPMNATISYSSNPALPGETVTVTISNLQETGGFSLTITAADEENSKTIDIPLTIGAPPSMPTLNIPVNNASEVALTPTFSWDTADNTSSYTISIATDENDFDGTTLFEETMANTFFTLMDELTPGIYFWKINAGGDCGMNSSDIFTFTTEDFNNINELEIEGLNIYPNPVSDLLFIEMNEENASFQAEILNIQGQVILEKTLQNTQNIDVTDFAKGVYWVKIFNNDGLVTKKITIQ